MDNTAFCNVLFSFYAAFMARFDADPTLISQTKAAIETAPGWARVGLTFGDEGMREAALNELAASIAARIENPPPEYDPAQLPLAL
jgi:hypothetical protein